MDCADSAPRIRRAHAQLTEHVHDCARQSGTPPSARQEMRRICYKEKPDTFPRNRQVARRGGGVARVARKKIEEETGKKVISRKRFGILEKD